MATTPNPLVWDFYRAVEGAEGLGGVAHYYDETSQSIWLSSGIKTNIADIPEGHWKTALVEDTIEVGTPAYETLALDHAHNGILFGVATIDNKLVFLRHIYAVDCTDMVVSGNLSYSNDNSVVQLKANIMNVKEALFQEDATVFQPGSKAVLRLEVGDEQPYDLCVAYLDAVDYNIQSSTVPISGRNNIGFRLATSTFDDNNKIAGLPHEVANRIFQLAGIKNYAVEAGTGSKEHEFNPTQTLMGGIDQLCATYGWKLIELPDGEVVLGSDRFLFHYRPIGYYVFDEGMLFKRKTKRSSDGAYTKVRITGKDSNENDLIPVTVPVKNYSQWSLPPNKTYHEEAPEGFTQSQLQAYAESVADSLQYVGIGEDFSGAIQPHLVIGDIVAVDNGDDTTTVLGIVTSIKHSFGKSGFTTEFSIDSGGTMMEDSGRMSTVTKPLIGYNRKQTLRDMIRTVIGGVGPGQPGLVKVIANSNAATLGGKSYEDILAAMTIKSGDVLTLPSMAITGTVTNQGTRFKCNLFLGRPVSAGMVTVTSCSMIAKQNGIYAVGAESSPVDVSGSISIDEISPSTGAILFIYDVETATEGIVDGEAVTYQIEGMTLTFSDA